MCKKPVWDDLSFVTWCIILLEVIIRRCVHCSHKGMDMVSNNTTGRLWRFKQCSIGTKGPKVCQENIPHTITPPPAWTVELTWCFHVLYAKFWPYHWMLQQKSRTHQTRQRFFQSSIVQFRCACANYSLRFLFLADRSVTRCGLLLLWPVCFRVRCVVRSEMVFCIPWL